MMSKTHFTIGLATSLYILQPQSLAECLIAVIGGAIGGVTADNDILDNDYEDDALTGQLLALGVTILSLVIDYYFNLGICKSIFNNMISAIIGGVAFIILWFIGFSSDHRTFTHSFLAMFLYSVAIAFISTTIAVGFMAAYLSHLCLDIFNKKKVPLFYPLRFGICLKLFYADRIANTILMYVGLVFSILLLLLGIFTGLTA